MPFDFTVSGLPIENFKLCRYATNKGDDKIAGIKAKMRELPKKVLHEVEKLLKETIRDSKKRSKTEGNNFLE